MSAALFANVSPRVNSILGANPSAWSAVVSGNVGAFPSDAEIAVAAIEADGELITKGYFNSINNSLAQAFMAPSAPIGNGGNIPFHFGNIGQVELGAVYPITNMSDVQNSFDVAVGPVTGTPVTIISSELVPSPLIANKTYYVNSVYNDGIQLAATKSDAIMGTAIDITTTGSGSLSLIVWEPGIETQSKDDIQNALSVGAAYVNETNAFNYLYKIEDNCLLHAASFGRVEVPTYTRTSELQADRADETLIVALTVRNLTKHASPAEFAAWTNIADKGMAAIIRDGSYQPMNPDTNA